MTLRNLWRPESGYYQEAVMGHYQEGMKPGIKGIPTFLIGNILFSGARPYEMFRVVMDEVLKQQAGR